MKKVQKKVVIFGLEEMKFPLITWYLAETHMPFVKATSSPHPFGKDRPYLTDGPNVEIFDASAILIYLADAYGGNKTPMKRAATTKWIIWAVLELDAMERERGPHYAHLDVIETLLTKSYWLLGDSFSVADVAVGAYLYNSYKLFKDLDLSKRPKIVNYLLRIGNRPPFAYAYGEIQAETLVETMESRTSISRINTASKEL